MSNKEQLRQGAIVALILIPALTLLAMVPRDPAVRYDKGDRPATLLLELFTSQGCSSCPPADQLLGETVARYPDRVVALAYHVDYWDRIGWTDPYGSASHSERQRAYATRFGSRSVYTPQLVIDGAEHVVGSDRARVAGALRRAFAKRSSVRLEVSGVRLGSDGLDFDYAISGAPEGARLRAVAYLERAETLVRRGENVGRRLVEHHIVLSERYLPQAPVFEGNGVAGRLTLPEGKVFEGPLGVALILEDAEGRPLTVASETTSP